MDRGIFPFNRKSKLDLAIAACIVAMVAFTVYEMRDLFDRLENKPTMTATNHSIMVSADTKPVAYCAWVKS